MLIGVLSDTHGRTEPIAAAVRQLQARKAAYYIHCGDVGSHRVLDHLAGLPAAFVWGNTDFDRLSLQRYAERLGIACFGPLGELTLDGKLIAFLHGDDAAARKRLLEAQRHDYILVGHTHARDDQRIGRTRLINPGALHRAAVKSVALLDTAADTVEFLQIDTPTELY